MFNSYFTPTSIKTKVDVFNELNKSIKILKRQKYSFHDMIKKEKSYIYNMLAKNAYFKGIIPRLYKGSKGVPYFNNIFKNALRKRIYFGDILDKINNNQNFNESDMNQPKTQRITKHYNLDEVELLKRKKIKLENKLKLFPKPLIRKNHSFILKSIKINRSQEKSEEVQNSNNKCLNLKLHKIKIKPFENINENFKSFTTTSRLKKIKKLNNLLDKCKSGIDQGYIIEKKFEKLYDENNKEDKNVNDENNKNNVIEVLNEDKKRGIDEGDSQEKYKALEELKFKEIKNEINFKISDLLAYSKRSEYKKKVKNPLVYKAYELYLEELNSINKENIIKKNIEKENISKIKNLLEGFHVEKELLNQKINKYTDKINYYKKLEKENENNFNEYDDNNKEIQEFEKMRSHLKNNKKDMTFITKLI